MITEAIYGVLTAILSFLVGLLPSWTRPTWLESVVTTVTDGVAGVAQLGNWIALEHIGIAAGFLLACWFTSLAIRSGRIVLSAVTGGGGSAA